MKTKKSFFYFSGIIVLIFLSQTVFYACPKCNQDFYKELMGQRGNTLGGQELLEAIKNQSIPGQPSPPVLPESFNSETDIKNQDTENSSENADDVKKDDNSGSPYASYYTYIIVFASLTFI